MSDGQDWDYCHFCGGIGCVSCFGKEIKRLEQELEAAKVESEKWESAHLRSLSAIDDFRNQPTPREVVANINTYLMDTGLSQFQLSTVRKVSSFLATYMKTLDK